MVSDSAEENPLNNEVSLSYEGKLPERDILATNPALPVELWHGDSGDDNRLYYGDNLPLLAHLLRDESVCGKVKLIYIDPPFATRSVFQSRTHVNAYCDLLAGARYIEFIRQRLVLLRELLADEGSIYGNRSGIFAN